MTPPIAVQLYTLREMLSQGDPKSILRRLAEIGYVGVELGGQDPAVYGPLCRELGLQISSAHLWAPVGEHEQKTLEAAEALGVTRIVHPWEPPERFATVDDIKAVCDHLNKGSEVARRHGLTLLYHNHWAEAWQVDGRSGIDLMLELLAPEVGFEIDTYWVKTGGLDPAEVVGKLGSRAPLLHIKDGPATDPQASMVAVGSGTLDFPAILARASADWLIVELDRCDTDMMTAVEQSYTYLTSKGLAHGR